MSIKMGLTINIRVSSNSLIWKCNWIVLVGGKCINHKTIGYEIVLNLVSYGIKKYYLSSRWRHVRIPLLEGTASSFMIMSISLKHCNFKTFKVVIWCFHTTKIKKLSSSKSDNGNVMFHTFYRKQSTSMLLKLNHDQIS